jgi:pyroglutamyl-peptidase
MSKILVTGFDAFGGESINPASRVLQHLERSRPCIGRGVEVITREIPTVFGASAQAVLEAIQDIMPQAVISIGQAGGAHGVRVERVALNINDARIADNVGNRPMDSPIEPDGPSAYWATIPVREVVEAIRQEGIPATLSYSAGTFVCNHVFYSACHFVASRSLDIKVGFIHVPYLPEQALEKDAAPSMSQECIIRALEAAVQTVAKVL